MFKGSVYCRKWVHELKDENGNPKLDKHGQPKTENRRAWGIRYSVNGGKVTREIVAETKDGAQAELDKKREDYQRRMLGVSEGKTLKDLAPLFLAHKTNQGRAMEPITVRVKSNLLPFFGALALEDIDGEAIDGYTRQRKAGGVENSTVNRDLAVLRHMLRLAVRKWRWLRQEPYLELLPENGPRELELSEAEEGKLLPVCSAPLQALILAALYTGMRQGELLSLTWAQVDLSGRVIDFPPTKRGRRRLMPIAEPLYYVLARMRADQQSKGGADPTKRVFLRPSGRPWTKWAVEAQLKTALTVAKIEKALVFHDLRRSFASRLKRRGVHETEIQRLLGHKSLQMTDRYITVEVEQMRAAVSVLPSTNLTQELPPVMMPAGNSP
jgi:integrase